MPRSRRRPAMSGIVSISKTRTGQDAIAVQPRSAAGRSARRQELGRIDRLALLADLEVQLHTVGVARAHLGDLLAAPHGLVVLDEQRLIVRVGGEVGRVVLE